MSDDKPGAPNPADETQPVRPEGGAALPPAPAGAPATEGTTDAAVAAEPAPVAAPTTGRRGFRERFATLRRSDGNRSFGLAALIASALAGIIVGGLGLAAIQAVGDDHDHGRDRGGWMQQRGPMGGGRDRDGDLGDQGGRGPMFGGPVGIPGQVQPTTPPPDDDSGTTS